MSDLIDRLISGLTVTEDEAKQDRIHLKLKAWTFQGNMLQFERFSTRLSQTFDVDGVQRRLFNVMQGNEHRPTWPITGGIGSRRYTMPPGLPLFSGRLRGYQQPSKPDQPIKVWHLVVDLFINPTRAMRHERDAYALSDRSATKERLLQVPPTMFSRARPSSNGLAFLSGDNFEAGSRLERSLFRQPLWGVNVERYWQGITDLLEDKLEDAALELNGAIYSVENKLTLDTIETYWDFPSRDPIATIASIEKPFRSLGSRSSVEWYSFPEAARSALRSRGVIIGDEDNAPVIKVHVAKGTQIKAYAKTSSTVRFEVTHSQGSADIGSYTASDPNGLHVWIARTSRGATTRLNVLLHALAVALAEPNGYQHLPQRLLNDLYGACKDWSKAWTYLSILIQSGKIEGRKMSPMGPDIKEMLRSKIIRRVSPRNAEVRIFHVTEKYRQALASFQG